MHHTSDCILCKNVFQHSCHMVTHGTHHYHKNISQTSAYFPRILTIYKAIFNLNYNSLTLKLQKRCVFCVYMDFANYYLAASYMHTLSMETYILCIYYITMLQCASDVKTFIVSDHPEYTKICRLTCEPLSLLSIV